jgi:nucleotide-binding universal stress UspA family protein
MDGSPQAETALEHALTELESAAVTVLYVIDPVDAGYGTPVESPQGGLSKAWYEQAEQRGEEVFEAAAAVAADHGVDVDTAIETGRPARTIVSHTEEGEFDHVVMGSHGRTGVSRVLLGSVAEQVVRRSTVPVTVVG